MNCQNLCARVVSFVVWRHVISSSLRPGVTSIPSSGTYVTSVSSNVWVKARLTTSPEMALIVCNQLNMDNISRN